MGGSGEGKEKDGGVGCGWFGFRGEGLGLLLFWFWWRWGVEGNSELRFRRRGLYSSRDWYKGRRVGIEVKFKFIFWEMVRERGSLES